jgi:nitrite reductase/ring-hydroxylating ferredoxin subunit
MDMWCDVADAGSLTPGNCRTVEARGVRIALVRLDDGFHALEDACPHRGGSMGSGHLDGCNLHCPLHGWAFDARSGAGLTRPDKPLRSFATRIEDGRVQVQLAAPTPRSP